MNEETPHVPEDMPTIMAERLAEVDRVVDETFAVLKEEFTDPDAGLTSLISAGEKMVEALSEQVAGGVLAYMVETMRDTPDTSVARQLKMQTAAQYERLELLQDVMAEITSAKE